MPGAVAPGQRLVELVHAGGEHRPDGAEARETYDASWDRFIARYAQAAWPGLPG